MRRVILFATVVLMVVGALAVDRGGAVSRPVAAAGVAPALGAPPAAPAPRRADVAPPGGREERGEPDPDARRAQRAPVELPAIAGRVAGVAVPASGDAWVVEAIRLTATRSAVTERRRRFVAPGTGGFDLGAVAAGSWQLAVVEPVFAWGPLVDVHRPEGLVIEVDPNPVGSLLVHPPRTGRAQLLAVRSPDLRGAAANLQVFVTAHVFVDDAAWQIAGLPAGDYEVVFARDASGPLCRAPVTVGTGPSTLDMR